MPWNLFLFPLLGGFQFLHVCHLYRFRASRFESERLLLHSASAGVVLLLLSRLLALAAKSVSWGLWLRWALYQAIPNKEAPYLGTAIAALGLGWSFAHILNVCIRIFGVRGAKLAIARHDEGLRVFLMNAMFDTAPVSITLRNRKVYIGYVDDMTETLHDKNFSLLLLLSGYRHPDSLEFAPSTNYVDQMKGDLSFRILLSVDEVTSANLFDLEVYQDRFASKQTSFKFSDG